MTPGRRARRRTSHTFATQGTYTVSLTVTDDDGALDHQDGQPDRRPAGVLRHVAFRASAAAQANSATQKVTVPAAVQSGDVMLLFATSNNGTAPSDEPAGWTLVGDQPAGAGPDIRTVVYEKVATGADHGSQLTLTYAAVNKVDLTGRRVLRGRTRARRSRRSRRRAETVSRTTHTAPSVDRRERRLVGAVVLGGQVVGDDDLDALRPARPSGRCRWARPAGRITSLLTDTNAVVPTGARAGITATADSASAKATMWTIVLKVAP